MIAEVSAPRRCAAWSLALLGLAGSILGWLGLYAVSATLAAGTVWWVGAGFLASAPAAVAALVISRGRPRLAAPVWIGTVALFVFATLWVVILVLKLAR